jgi:hypothetical protein
VADGLGLLYFCLLAVLFPEPQKNVLIRFWGIADEVSPLAKLMFGGLLGIAFWLLARIERKGGRLPKSAFAIAAMAVPLTVMAVIPAEYSRGFGIGFSGERFALIELAVWLSGTGLGGLVFTFVRQRA